MNWTELNKLSQLPAQFSIEKMQKKCMKASIYMCSREALTHCRLGIIVASGNL